MIPCGLEGVKLDFSNHPLNNNRQSIIDETNKLTKSIIDYHTDRLRTKLNDPTIGAGMVALGLRELGEAELNNISDYALRKADNPGKVFVKICGNTVNAKLAA